MYKIIGADGKEYGPVTIEQLRDWLTQKRLSAQTRILAPGSTEWRPAVEVPELAALFSPTPVAPVREVAPPILSASQVRQPRKGMALLSFVLGLSSVVLCLSIIAALPAIVLGHIARSRAKRSPEKYAGSGFGLAGIILGYVSIFATLIFVTMVIQLAPQNQVRRFPTRQFPGPPPVSDCQNNLRQIGLALKVWALEHNDQFPFNVSTNAGGSLELCSRDNEGFEKNPIPHLQVIANDLSTPTFLVCPKDSKHAAADFSSLRLENISYRFRTGTNVNDNNPQEILAVCPIHGNVLYCDGNVRKK